MRIKDNQNQNPSEVAKALRQHMAETSISQVRVAKAIGMSNSIVSQYLSGTYAGDIDAVENKVKQWLDLEIQRSERPFLASTEVIPTHAVTEITQALRIAARDRDMVVITGPAGAGKTTTLQAYARQNSSSILIEADHGYTAMALFAELCDCLSLPTKGTLHELLRRVVEKLRDSDRLIIVDEAEHLPYRALELLRRVHDKSRVPLALVGMPRLRKNLQGDHNHYAQLWSRVGFVRSVDLLSPKDEAMFVEARIGKVTDDVLDAIRKGCRHNARVLVKLLRWCAELCRLNESELSLEIVAKASELVTVA
ncbi:MAG TPA: AAA family ATPase [Fibrobacteria bacterium]|nr:AAA family ATPase [Fibrobacteria bacterium]